jgi:hypothetical protein
LLSVGGAAFYYYRFLIHNHGRCPLYDNRWCLFHHYSGRRRCSLHYNQWRGYHYWRHGCTQQRNVDSKTEMNTSGEDVR